MIERMNGIPNQNNGQSVDRIKAGTQVEVRKVSVKAGEQTQVGVGSVYEGKLVGNLRNGGQIELTDEKGQRTFNSSQIVGMREEKGRIILETATSFYEVRLAGVGQEQAARPGMEGLQREYGLNDIIAFQEACKGFDALREHDKANYILGVGQFYEYLVSGSFSERVPHAKATEMAGEPDATENQYQSLILNSYLKWRENTLKNWDEVVKRMPNLQGGKDIIEREVPASLAELRNLYRKYRPLSQVSGVMYQDGLGEEGEYNNPFLHFFGNRMSGYAYSRPETAVRMYANPPRDAVPMFAEDFMRRAENAGVPFYFKMVDFSLQKPNRSDASRMDRFVYYVGNEDIAATRKIFEEMQQEHPEWFNNRPLPPLVASIKGGIGVAEDPSKYQDQHFSRSGEPTTSFNWVRAQFLKDVWTGLAQDMVRGYPNIKAADGRTLREIFEGQFKDTDQVHRQKIMGVGLDPAQLNDAERYALNDALVRFVVDAMPQLDSQSIAPLIERHVLYQAQRYHINPRNLAANTDK